MLGAREDLGGGARFDDLALGHDAHAGGHRADDAEVVGDEQEGHAQRGLEPAQQFEDLRLDGDVEGRGGLVGDQEVGLVGQGHGDHHALALPSRELVRIGAKALLRFGQSHQPQQLQGARAGRRPAQVLVHEQDLAHLLLDGV